ncbi:unnamed protein product [Effrenium voratum]|uniref:Glycosyl transferase family 25 domain-containing protein n=1 Tax=Effrenium voratum TaxID=2562239 RepID=A0AA36NBH1_9DINO|nr:unnamed protein product [Effrenium voratum]CAJ1438264.1 unnamed protein product [Effrenium voratum]
MSGTFFLWSSRIADASGAFRRSTARAVIEPDVCSGAKATLLPPRGFHLSGPWRPKCRSLPHPDADAGADGAGADAGGGRNWCWEYVRHQCYGSHGYGSWWEDQLKASRFGLAPDPRLLRLFPLERPELCEQRLETWEEKGADEDLAWLREEVAVYVVNLRTATDRWKAISERLTQLKIPFQRLEGVEADEWPGPRDGIGRGTAGVALAHLKALEQAARGAAPLALILEDDAWLAEGFASKLRQLTREAPCQWQVISLKSRCPFGSCVSKHLSQVVPDGNGGKCSGLNFGFLAMLYQVRSLEEVRAALKRAVWHEKCYDVDVALASISDQVAYYAVPSIQRGLVKEMGFESLRDARNKESGTA